MSIVMRCPKGHALKIKDSLAGKIVRCPACKTPFIVPRPEPEPEFSEDDIIDVLAADDPTKRDQYVDLGESSLGGSSILSLQKGGEGETPKKICEFCKEEIDAGTHICPFCKRYIANMRDLYTN
jgi:hypothetical protein